MRDERVTVLLLLGVVIAAYVLELVHANIQDHPSRTLRRIWNAAILILAIVVVIALVLSKTLRDMIF